jgi:diguanylate cyclase (GGDEF)-like protein
VLLEGEDALAGRAVVLEGEVVLGRDDGCALRLDADDVSRRHARIVPDGDGHAVVDLGSTNGTFVNGERVVAARRLAPGDRLAVGPYLAKYVPANDPEARLAAELHRRAHADPLTGLPNRRAFEEGLAREIARAARASLPLAVLALDVDHFKRVNDAHGHPAGDEVLRTIAACLAQAARAGDLVGRVGGEEFAAALPGADLAQAREVAERIRARVAAEPVAAGAAAVPVTVSIGVASLGADAADGPSLLARADARLYEAKRSGRNRVAS